MVMYLTVNQNKRVRSSPWSPIKRTRMTKDEFKKLIKDEFGSYEDNPNLRLYEDVDEDDDEVRISVIYTAENYQYTIYAGSFGTPNAYAGCTLDNSVSSEVKDMCRDLADGFLKDNRTWARIMNDISAYG